MNMEIQNYWEENGHTVKYDNYTSSDADGFGRIGELNFAAQSEDEADYAPGYLNKKGKVSRQDPMSHRIIEKRRRDRMNNCLADLSRLIPPDYLKKGRGRVEKTEIIEMAIRHLKYLQERANAAERQVGDFRGGYQEAVAEAGRYLVEMQGYSATEGLSVQLAAHLQKHCDHIMKGEAASRDKHRCHGGSSSETTSSSGSSNGYLRKSAVVATAPPAAGYQPESLAAQPYPMECDRVGAQPPAQSPRAGPEPLALDARAADARALRSVRKPEHGGDDYLHSYKFKNSIERRFSRSQDTEAAELAAHSAPYKVFTHKRRRGAKVAMDTSTSGSASTSNSGSGSAEEARDTSPQDTSSESPHQHPYDKPPPEQLVPVFALSTLGKYYVPLNVGYSCLARHLTAYDVLDARAAAVHLAAPLHPVTIHVNFQPCLNYSVKREPNERDWPAN